jgi:hypothetical protein
MATDLKAWWRDLNKNYPSGNTEIITYQVIRRTLGILGLSLPIVLYVGTRLFAHGCVLQPSISHYYYTNMREIFVGVLCAFSLFLFTYKGYSRLDSWAANVAGFFCLGVAMFPTNLLCDFPCQKDVIYPVSIDSHTTVHFICASAFFLTLGSYVIFSFHENQSEGRTEVAQAYPEWHLSGVRYWHCDKHLHNWRGILDF